ncbi:MAG TPA: hypothetical protein VGK88_08375 [bacterium]
MKDNELENYRKLLDEHLGGLGRDDIAIGELSESEPGQLRVQFVRGTLHHEAIIPVDSLKDRELARQTLNEAFRKLSKAVERQHIEEASKSG